MKDYKRLTKKSWHDTKFCGLNEREVLHRLCALENKIENGTLIELPCKVGTTVYYVGEYKEKIGLFRWIDSYTIIPIPFDFDMLNTYKNNWFLTKAEAEKKLGELKNEN